MWRQQSSPAPSAEDGWKTPEEVSVELGYCRKYTMDLMRIWERAGKVEVWAGRVPNGHGFAAPAIRYRVKPPA